MGKDIPCKEQRKEAGGCANTDSTGFTATAAVRETLSVSVKVRKVSSSRKQRSQWTGLFPDRSGDDCNVNLLNATDLYTKKWLKR